MIKDFFEHLWMDKDVLLSIYCKTMKKINAYYLQGTALQLIAMMTLDIIIGEGTGKLGIVVILNSSINNKDSTALTLDTNTTT